MGPAGWQGMTEDTNRTIDEQAIKPVIDKVYAFLDAHAAFDHLECRPFGKVVVQLKNEFGSGFSIPTCV